MYKECDSGELEDLCICLFSALDIGSSQKVASGSKEN